MSNEQLDTRVTAYVFGELSPEATAAFERELEKSQRLREEVDAIRETVDALKCEFESQAAGVSDKHRKAIELAIHRRSASTPAPPTPPPIVPSDKVSLTSDRRLLAVAALAASVLIICSLAYPSIRGRGTSPVAMDDNSPAVALAVEKALVEAKVDAKANQEIVGMVESFNQLIQEQRYDEADVVAQQVFEMQPDSPIGRTLQSTSRMGRQIADGNAKPAPQAYSAQMTWEASPRSGVDLFGGEDELAPATGRVSGRGIAGQPLEEKQQAGAVQSTPGSRLSSSDDEFGLRPSKAPASSFGYGGSTAGAPVAREAAAGYADDSEAELSEFSLEESEDLADAPYDGDGLAANAGRPSRRRRSGTEMMEMEDMMGMDMGMDMDMDMEEEMMQMDGMGMMGMGLGVVAQGDRFEPIEDNPFVDVDQAPLSTFSVDVDTASYAKVRSLLRRNLLPRPAAVRIEELLNYFPYGYAPPQDGHPFAASMEIASCPWNQQHRLARIGIQGKVIEAERPSSNLVFLLDVSGSMDEPNRLPLVIEGMKMLTDQLTENDKVAIVVYAGAAGLVLDATRGDKKRQIISALDRLKAGGSTNGGQGILLAYEIARDNFIVGGTNRVILCSDGDFNVGVTGTDQLVRIAQENAKSNVFLSVLGFGIGNHNDAMMEQISNRGNGNYAFIDSKAEARKVLVEELRGTLVTIAKDVKIQVEFNPKEVASYRLIGYENRILQAEDFNDDRKDAGEIGAGHTVTALYEIVPAEEDDAEVPPVDDLRYQKPAGLSNRADSGEMLVLKLRYKQPDGDTSTLIEFPVTDSGKRFSQSDRDFKFAASVAAFGMLLRNSPHRGQATLLGVAKWAADGAQGDDFGYRNAFLELVTRARQLRGE